jgi:hypothetical protein
LRIFLQRDAEFSEGMRNTLRLANPRAQQQPIENQNHHMKTISLVAAMFLTVAFARPAAADKLTLFQGYIVADETAQFVGDKIIVDGNGSGNSTLGKFTIIYHFKVNPTTGRGNGSSHLTFANGDTWTTNSVGLGDNTGVDAVASITELHFVTQATGRFADAVGDFRLERMLDQATGKTSGSFKGEFLKTTP